MIPNLSRLTLADLELLERLPQYRSLRALARRDGLTVSQISKQLKRVEELIDKTIVKRSTVGYEPTEQGLIISHTAREALLLCDKIVDNSTHIETSRKKLALGTRGFVNALVAPALVAFAERTRMHVDFQFLDFSPEELVDAGFRRGIDLAVSLERLALGESWFSREVGTSRWGLYVRAGHPLERDAKWTDLRNFPLLRSAYWDGRTVVSAADPLPRHGSRWGHEVQTAATAVAIVAASNAVGLLPDLAIAGFRVRDELRRLPLSLPADEITPVILHVNQDTVDKKTFSGIEAAVRDCLAEFR